MARAFFPLDEQLNLDGSDLLPQAQEVLVRLASWLSFGHAVRLLEALLGVQVSRATARRHSEAAGAEGLAAPTAPAEQITRQLPESPPGEEKQLLSCDGAFVPQVGGEWVEVKTVAIAQVTCDEQGQVSIEHPSYFSRLTDAQTFEQWALVETQRRGLERAGQVAAVQDGAEWLQPFVDFHRADALRILDFAHAAEYVSEFRQLVSGAGGRLAPDWLAQQLHTLKHEGPRQLLQELSGWQEHYAGIERLEEILVYLRKREAHRQYPTYQAAGGPIGSGMVESANKVVVEARLKGAGRHWQRQQVNPMLVLRSAVCNERWDETWHVILTRRQHQQRQRRLQESEQRLSQATESLLLTWLRVCGRFPSPAVAAPPPATVPTPRRSSGYSWSQPFLRRAPTSSPVPGGLRAKL